MRTGELRIGVVDVRPAMARRMCIASIVYVRAPRSKATCSVAGGKMASAVGRVDMVSMVPLLAKVMGVTTMAARSFTAPRLHSF